MKKKCIIAAIACLISFNMFGQLLVDFPLEKGVYQRKNNNTLDVTISGRYTDTLTTTIETRLLSASSNQPVSGFDWQTLAGFAELGKFYGILSNVPGGKYHLQIRNLNGLFPIDTFQVNNLGIGEVFMVSGQSNAAGYQDFASVSAQSNDVVSHNFSDDQTYGANTSKIPPFPVLSKIEFDTYVSEKGQSSWCYGKLGDLLTARLGVPVSFFNGASVGTSTKNWMESAQGLPTQNEYFAAQYGNLVGMPYVHLKNILHHYATQFGTRANLWHQGETDTFKNYGTQYYVDNLNLVKSQTRTDFHPDLSWVVSRVSFDGNNSSPQVIGGQNTVVQADINTFYGPSTDQITYRNPDADDNVHFFGPSLISLANEWDLELNASFFQNSKPVTPKPIQEIKLRYENGLVWLIAPPNFASYRWINATNGNKNYEQTPESTKAILKKSSGKYICYLIEANGNIVPSQIVDAGAVLSFFAKNPPVCEGVVYLSDLTETSLTGQFKKDISQNNTTLSIDGEQFSKGLGSHSYFKITYNILTNTYKRFKTFIGVDDSVTSSNCTSHDGVIFKVYGNDLVNPLFTSSVLNADSPVQYIDLQISNQSSLTLEVEQVGNINCDHANWADAKLTFDEITPPIILSDKSIVNKNQLFNLSASVVCQSSSALRWSDGNSVTVNQKSLSSTNTYFATCVAANNCQSSRSNTISIKVLNDCETNYQLASPTNDLGQNGLNLNYEASNAIQASNKLQNKVKVSFDAAKSITLSPGFLSDSGTNFTAQIGGCTN
ncbi:MAG: hypothetical protein ACI9V1_002106 [Spirosomataceae bacterium]|jgi:hypothetical protein